MTNTLIQTIEADLSAAGQWLEQEVESEATAVWNIVKVAFQLITSKQVQVLLDVFNRLQSDLIAGMSLEQIETDLLNTATADEKIILEEAGSAALQGFIAFLRANAQASA